MRIHSLLLAAICAVLSACNAAMSDHPMFAEAERSSRISLEDGLWYLVKPDCEITIAQPKESWPKCADWVIIRANTAIKGSDTKPDQGPEDLFIVDGKPPLIQAKVEANGSKDAYGFLALEAQSFSRSKRITSAKVWMVPCGIDEATEGATPKVTPYAGFTKDCMPETVKALRAAAAKGPAKSTDVVEWRWVRAEAP
jgi:hypothetical protein